MKKIAYMLIAFGLQTTMAQAMNTDPSNTERSGCSLARVRVMQDPQLEKSDNVVFGLSDPTGSYAEYAYHEELFLIPFAQTDTLKEAFNEPLKKSASKVLGKYLGPEARLYDMLITRFSFYPTKESKQPLTFSELDLERQLNEKEFEQLANSYASKTRRHPMDIYSIHVAIKKKQ